MKVFAPIMTT